VNLFRQTDPTYPFSWESPQQPQARWHGSGEGPVHYFATTPEGAWAEFLRHEEITDPEDLKGLRERAMWIVTLPDSHLAQPNLPQTVLLGGLESYAACQAEARRLREAGTKGLRAPSAALAPGGASLYHLGALEDEAERRTPTDSEVVALFGMRPDLKARLCALGRPDGHVLRFVRPL
jgi:hypothetical protein